MEVKTSREREQTPDRAPPKGVSSERLGAPSAGGPGPVGFALPQPYERWPFAAGLSANSEVKPPA